MSKKIISYSLWSDIPMYNVGAIRNAEQVSEFYPDWIARFYIGSDVPEETVNKISQQKNTEVVMMDEDNDWQGSLWRFYAVDTNEDVDVVIFRDTDSRLSRREYEAVREWYQSDRCLHIMRDHPYHSETIMAGMWGCRVKPLLNIINENVYDKFNLESVSNLQTVIDDWLKNEHRRTLNKEPNCLKPEHFVTKGIDQRFLRDFLYKMMGKNKILNDDAWIQDSYPMYNCYSGRFDVQRFPGIKELSTGFPTILNEDWNGFIGQVFDENDKPNEDYARLIRERDECIYQDWKKKD